MRVRVTTIADLDASELVQVGVLRAPERGSGVGEDLWRLPRPADPKGLVLQALLDERRDGR